MIKVDKVIVHDAAPNIIAFKTNKGAALSMQRALTSTEYNYSRDLVDSKKPNVLFTNEFFEGRKMFDKNKIKKMTSKNVEFHKEVTALRPLARKNEDKYKIFRPIVPLQEDYTLEEKKVLIEVGIFSLYDGLVVPDSPLIDASEFSSHISKLLDFLEKDAAIIDKSSFDLIPQIAMQNKPDVFKDKLNALLDLNIDRVDILNDSLTKYYPNYSYLRKFSKNAGSNVLVFGSQVKRVYRLGKYRLSTSHVLPLYGQDILASAFSKPFIVQESQRNPLDRPKREVLLFDKHTNGLLTRGEHNQRYGEATNFENNPYTNGETLTSFFDKYTKEELFRISRVLEALDSQQEIKNERDKAINNEKEYLRYISKKEFMIPIIRKLGLLQTKLF